MKNLSRYKLLVLFTFFFTFVGMAQEKMAVINGIVKNHSNNKKIENVTLSVPGSNIATVTNSDGVFVLKVPENLLKNGIKAEHMGFQSLLVSAEEIQANKDKLTITLQPVGKNLKEVVVKSGDPKKIVEEALKKIPQNYSEKDNLFSAFYRETVQKGSRYISISEAVVDVLKKPYRYRIKNGEKVGIHKGRKLLSQRSSDTLAVKLEGGPFMPIALDVVKNADQLFSIDEMDYFVYDMRKPVMIDDRMHFVIGFEPNVNLLYPLYRGQLYIDQETMAISRAEFSLDMSDRNKVTNAILHKKPNGLKFKPEEVSGVATYKLVDGKSYLNYLNSRIKFKCDWKKRLFASSYTTNAEMVMVDRDDNPEKNMKIEGRFDQNKIFSDIVENYWEEDFWKDYNIIEPTESLDKAVDKLRRRK